MKKFDMKNVLPGSGGGSGRRGLFAARPVGKQRTRGFMLGLGAAGVFVLLLMGVLSFRVADSVPGRTYYDLYAQFEEADNLSNHYEVRIGGKRAGQVLDPEVKDGLARVKVRLDSEFGPLRSDTKTRVRLRSAVGVRYLELTPGTQGRILEENETIPATNQTDAVALDAVLGAFDPDTREGLRTFLSELGGGVAGNGAGLNAALGSADDFLADLGSLSKAITDKPGAMRGLINGSGRLMSTLNPVRGNIANLFEEAEDSSRAFADTRENLHATLDQAPSTLSTASSRLPSINRFVSQVDGLAREGRPTLEALPGALRPTTTLLRAAQPPLREADDTLDNLREASGPTLRLLRRLQPELPDVSSLIDSATPVITHLIPRQCELVNFTTGWANVHKWGDKYGAQTNFFIDGLNLGNGFALGGTSSETIPDLKGGNLLDRFHKSAAYPGPCDGNSGESGDQTVTVEEAAQGYRYDYNHRQGSGGIRP